MQEATLTTQQAANVLCEQHSSSPSHLLMVRPITRTPLGRVDLAPCVVLPLMASKHKLEGGEETRKCLALVVGKTTLPPQQVSEVTIYFNDVSNLNFGLLLPSP